MLRSTYRGTYRSMYRSRKQKAESKQQKADRRRHTGRRADKQTSRWADSRPADGRRQMSRHQTADGHISVGELLRSSSPTVRIAMSHQPPLPLPGFEEPEPPSERCPRHPEPQENRCPICFALARARVVRERLRLLDGEKES